MSVIAKLATKPHTNLMHFFIKTLQNCDNQSFQEHSALMKICLHVDVESPAREHFVKKKIL